MIKNFVHHTIRFAFLFVLLSLTFTASAQTPADAKATLTEQERADAIKYLADTREKFLASIEGLSEAQWRFKPAPDRWSVAEVAEHIAISEEEIFGLISQRIMSASAAPEKKESVKGKDKLVRDNITNRNTKRQAPESLKPVSKWATQTELVKAFNASRDKTVNYVKTTQDDLRSHFGPHPVFRDLDAYQWMLLLAGHSERHTLQILEVKADPNFPKK